MRKIKPSAIAGIFYENNEAELKQRLSEFKLNTKNDGKYYSRAVILPHAGYEYSGKLAMKGLKYLDKSVKNIFIFAPTHRYFVKGAAVPSHDAWETPLGEVELNKVILNELTENFKLIRDDKPFEEEHSLEVQIPLVQTLFSNIKIVPVIIGNVNYKKITEIISHYWENKENGFIISSDLSHFNALANADKIDEFTANKIENLEPHKIFPEQACGFLGIAGLVNFAKQNKFSMIRIGKTNSSETTGDTSRVVGYGSWFVYEGEKTEYIRKYLSEYVKKVCRTAISDKLNAHSTTFVDVPAVLNQSGACFVTLELNNELRGCIGSIIPYQTLLADLIQNSVNAAFKDPRFSPLTRFEFENADISVSLLSLPVKMDFKDESDLLEQLVPFKDGLVISDNNHEATYLPVVWEMIPDKVEFLRSLKQKAGLSPDYFSKTFTVYRYGAEYIK